MTEPSQYYTNMADTIKVKTLDGTTVEFIDKVIGAGTMKDVYFSPDKSYVVALFREKQDFNSKDRLITICGIYRDRLFNQVGGDYWKELYCWPTNVLEYNGKLGLVAPAYRKPFFFTYGSRNNDCLSIKGQEKEGKWFASASLQSKFLDEREKGDWFKYFLICIKIARGAKRLHSAGLAHSDLSYKNVLIDPIGANAAIIDIDGLVVPGKYPPDVIGTPDFIAPEVMATKNLKREDTNRKFPCRATDQHALATMIYMYLLYRHPLRGGQIHDVDPQRDEELSMGQKALFVEHPSDLRNRPNLRDTKPAFLPWADVTKLPYGITGPYLKALFDRAFIDGLHNPNLRPTADDWERDLLKTIDLMQPCLNPNCAQKWFVFNNTTKPVCPFCGTPFKGQLPILNFYSSRKVGVFTPDNYRLMVYHNQYLYQWHVNKNIFPNERISEEQKKPVGYFVFHEGRWILINQKLHSLFDKSEDKQIPIGSFVELTEGKKILLSNENGGRLIIVQLANN